MKYTPDYWATIAQILPVVMLALVVEGRAVARNLSRKKVYPHNRGLRMFYSGLFVLNFVGIYLAFLIALSGAAEGEIDTWERVLAHFGLYLGISTVFLTPLIAVCSALVGDWVVRAWHRFPLSKMARGMRMLDTDMQQLDRLTAQFRHDHLDRRVRLAQSYVRLYRDSQDERALDAVLPLLDARRDELDEERREITVELDRIYAKAEEIRSKRKLADEDFEAMRELVKLSAR